MSPFSVLFVCVTFIFMACGTHEPQSSNTKIPQISSKASTESIIDTSGTQLKTRVLPPTGFIRPSVEVTSFAAYLRNLPLKSHGSPVHLFNGNLKGRQDVHTAVFDVDIGSRDLQQCADAVMRLRAEYLWQKKAYDQIQFNFTNGFPATYSRWRSGERIRVTGSSVSWYDTGGPTTSYESFRKYLTMVFSYAGTLSLEKELTPVSVNEIRIGDVFIQGGSPGHAVLVVDQAVHPQTGEKLVLLAQSYMPAQDIHVLVNPLREDVTPWFALSDMTDAVLTPEWRFLPQDLRRF
ncbi:MAG: DUF4846 domain-containing protein [Bacteroidota bacterium]